MNNSILSAALISAAILGGLVGGGINEHQTTRAQELAWDGVLVVHNGTLVANPSAMDPVDLADSQILPRSPRLIGYQCDEDGERSATEVRVGWNEDDFPPCREIVSLR